ncbi:MAG: hypothetical protein H3C71_01565 [Flavobacteriales bacterium]|nr:hypothetical protein [Flavobacteriales bacterium]
MNTKQISIESQYVSSILTDTTTSKTAASQKEQILNADEVTIDTSLSLQELTERLRSLTITDISQIHNSPQATYYGEINSYNFQIMNVKYGPMSSFPPIQGEIEDGAGRTTIKVKMDIKSHFKMARTMYYTTLLPIGLIVLLLSFLVLGGTAYLLHGILFSSSFILCALLVVALTKSSLINTKRKELKNFASKIDGSIIG